jgi:penicillin V acylase-like amidase (Ntn superfamily)
MKYKKGERLNIHFNNKIRLEFHGARFTSDGGLLAYRELDEAKYPEPDERSAFMEIQWIQYQLDKHESVKEVIQSDKEIRIAQNISRVHYLVCDRTGDVATIEFID